MTTGTKSSDAAFLPYQSLPFAYTQPSALAAVAALQGVTAPPAETARVLELGCAGGGNTIPLAARFPNASFTAIDISEDEIAIGRARVKALGLTNMRIEAIDILDFAETAQQFDYIIAHGVLSWVPAPVQQAVFKICREQLAPDGIAVISFNVLPGWGIQQIVRDICMRNVDHTAPPLERARQAQAALRRFASVAAENNPYGIIVRQAAQRAAGLSPSYLLAEFLAAVNECFFFEDVVKQAAASGLHYIGEGELAMATPELLAPDAARGIREMGAGDRVKTQSHLDMVSGRIFRRAVFAKRPGHEHLDVSKLLTLHINGAMRQDPQAPTSFRFDTGQVLRAPNEDAVATLAAIAHAYPNTIPVSELVSAARNGAQLAQLLLQLVSIGSLRVSTLPLRVGRASAAKPRAFDAARIEATENQGWVTTLLHRSTPLTPDAMALLASLDGDHDRAQLIAEAANWPSSSAPASARVDTALALLEREALLLPN